MGTILAEINEKKASAATLSNISEDELTSYYRACIESRGT